MRLMISAAIYMILQMTPVWAQKFQADDPVRVDNDAVIDAKELSARRLSDYYDFIENTFLKAGDRSAIRALNINTLGEVPDSSWFTNRDVRQPLAIAAGPSTNGAWEVIAAKTEGITPGFRIRDSRGDVYVIKFDPVTNPEMATAAEIISTRFFGAIGYNVPENHLVFFKRNQLVVGGKAKIEGALGKVRAMTAGDLDAILSRVHRGEDGAYRAVASKFLDGKPLGPFRYYGTRSDDPNDVFPHEHRRELRGLAVIAAWLNHDDSRAINSLDMLVAKDGKQYVRHYLIDFGSTLGSGSVAAQKARAGNEYMWEAKPAFARIATLGLWDRPWIRAKYPDMPSVGLFEGDVFDPKNWKPEYPNPAFTNLLPEDAYWGAKLVMSFTSDDIRAIVATGKLSDKGAEQYLADTLIQRRDKIGRYWLSQLASFDNFRIEGSTLRFDHLASQYDFEPKLVSITASWYEFNNDTGEKSLLAGDVQSANLSLELPQQSASPESLLLVDISGRVSVYFRQRQGSFEIVGIERR